MSENQQPGEPVATGNDGLEWPHTFDGMAWAIEFNKQFPSVTVDDALGWFCNAIMRGWDTYAQKHPRPRVGVTEAMVEAAAKMLAYRLVGCTEKGWNGDTVFTAEQKAQILADARVMLTAALAAATGRGQDA